MRKVEWIRPKSANEIELGSEVRDLLSGVLGFAAARIEYLTGCTQIAIAQQGVDDKGKPREWNYFDWQRLEVSSMPNLWAHVRQSEPTRRADGAGEPPSGRY